MTVREILEEQKRVKDEMAADREAAKAARPFVNAAAVFVMGLSGVLALAVTAGVVGGVWWVLTGKPMFGG